MKLKSLTSFRKKTNNIKNRTSPLFLEFKSDNIFHNQKSSLEYLSNLIKFNEINFFSSPYKNNDPIFIIETLETLKKSLLNSFNKQTKDKIDLINKVKNIYLNFYHFFRIKIMILKLKTYILKFQN